MTINVHTLMTYSSILNGRLFTRAEAYATGDDGRVIR
jgi:hypothetical protein